jgi:hypothetical protein
MPLQDDPALLRGPIGFAARINADKELDVDAARQRLPGLLMFARTFIGLVLEEEFDTPLAGFPMPARTRAAGLSSRLRHAAPASEAAQRFVMSVVDICDLEIDRTEMSGDEEEDEGADLDEILELVQRLLSRFAEWIDENRLPKLAKQAERARKEFAAASGKLKLQ